MSSSLSSYSGSSPPTSEYDPTSPPLQSATLKRFSGSPIEPPIEISVTPEQPLPTVRPVRKARSTLPHAPRPPNAFILYRSEQLKELKKKGSTAGISQSLISKMIGGMWREESPDVRKWFVQRADEKKVEHLATYPDYRYAPLRKVKSEFVAKPPKPKPVKNSAKPLSSRSVKPKATTIFPVEIAIPEIPDVLVSPSLLVSPRSSTSFEFNPPNVDPWRQPLQPSRFPPTYARSVSDFGPSSYRSQYDTRQLIAETKWSTFAGEMERERGIRFGGSERDEEEVLVGGGWVEEEVMETWISKIHVQSPCTPEQPTHRTPSLPQRTSSLPHQTLNYLSPQISSYSHTSSTSYFEPRSPSTSTSPYTPSYSPTSPLDFLHSTFLPQPHEQEYQYQIPQFQLPQLESLEIQRPCYDIWNPLLPSAPIPNPWGEHTH